jgi:hypothetical protein
MKYLKCAGRVERYLTKNGIRYMAGISHSQLSVWDIFVQSNETERM